MDLVRAMEFIQNCGEPNLVEHAGDVSTDKSLSRLANYKYPAPLQVSTLTSFIEYIISSFDFVLEDDLSYLVIIDSPVEVRLLSQLDDDERRRHLITAQAFLPKHTFGTYIQREQFQIALQSKFEASEDLDNLLAFLSHVQSGTIAEYGDDGISQKATISRGVQGKTDVIIPNPVELIPYRTFVDLDVQPASKFIFRMQDDDRLGVMCGLWEADGGAWTITAVSSIKQMLTGALEDHLGKLTIIG